MNSTTHIAYTDPETGETKVFRPRPATTDQRLDRIIELLELIAEATLTSAHPVETGSTLTRQRIRHRIRGGSDAQ